MHPTTKATQRRARISAPILALAAAAFAAAFACGCGGSSPAPTDSPVVTTSPHPTATPSPPASTKAPILDLGESASYVLPDGGVVTVTVDDFTATVEDKLAANERVVSLKLVVRAEAPDGSSGQTVALTFKASSFLLVAADDSLYVPPETTAKLYDAPWETAASTGFTLSFVVPDTAELVRFVCTPKGKVTPRSATWLLK